MAPAAAFKRDQGSDKAALLRQQQRLQLVMMLKLLLTFPSVLSFSLNDTPATSLSGQRLQLPSGLGPENVLVIAFSREHAKDLESWESFLSRTGLPFAAFLTMGPMNETLKTTISLAMRASLSAQQEARTFLYFEDIAAFTQAQNITDTSQLLLYHCYGNEIAGMAKGAYAPEKVPILGL